jgi:hypothetical protein
MNYQYRILLLYFFLLSTSAFSQIDNKRCKWVKFTSDPFVLDSTAIFPGSLRVVYPATGTIISLEGEVVKLKSDNAPDSLFVCYQIFPFNITKPAFKRDRKTYDSGSYFREDFTYKYGVPQTKEELFSSPGLNKSGNISRGISFGNNQSVFVNSVLNLQLEGKLSEDVSITAVISDQNIPFQPDGNTQQIQEFDKVYVQLQSKNASLIAGDVVMKNKNSNFLRYYRNVQGVQGDYFYKKDSTISSVTSVGAALSKGKFSSMQFGYGMSNELLEGVQGPYRLRGPNGERFIVIMANSERIYLDGKLLTRGFDFDYIIDYNQAEITFTNNILITKFSRIRVDFEYSDRNYSRSIINASHHQTYKKTDVYFNFYQEKDNPQKPINYELSNQDKFFLSLIGDSINKSFIPGVDTVSEFSTTKVLYKNIGTQANPVYAYSTNPDSAKYQLSFTQVAIGAGSYVQDINTVNGRVYRFVGPGNGSYLPVLLVVTPKMKNMATIGGGYALTKTDYVFAEIGFSKSDQNLYSELDSEDDKGKAYKIGYINKGRTFSGLPSYKLSGTIDYEYDEQDFAFIDRVRSTDFDRDWNANSDLKSSDHIFNTFWSFAKDPANAFTYKFSRRDRGNDVNGSQHTASANKSFGKLQLMSNVFYMNNNTASKEANWKRFNLNTFYTTRYFIPGISYTEDKNIIKDSTGRIIASNMYYDELKMYIKSSDTTQITYFVDYSVRNNERNADGELYRDSKSQTTNAGLSARINDNNQINLVSTYRYLNNYMVSGIRLPNEETVMGRLDWNSDILQRHIRSELTITTGTGRELKREIAFIPVVTGQGTHVWVDLNSDKIQDLNEFFEKKYDDPNGEFIKTFVPTDEYIKAYTNTFNYRLDASAPRKWASNPKRVKQFFSRFSSFSSWTVNKKITDADLMRRFIPVSNNIEDQNILSIQEAIRSTLFYNRSNPKYGLDLSYLVNDNKQFLVQGFERKQNYELKLGSRVNINSFSSFKMQAGYGLKKNNSDFLANRNYEIQSYKISPEAAYQPKNNLRVTALLGYTNKANVFSESEGETVLIYESGLDVRFNKVSKRTINAVVKYLNIKSNFKSTTLNSPLGYEMLEALQPGNNFTWTFNWQERLANGLQLSFNYEGRKAGENKMIHIGRMQISALF